VARLALLVESSHAGLHQQGRLAPPDVPGRALAHVALLAPHDWSGSVVAWDDERVQQLLGA
jgi:hypothetical protein